MKANNDVRSYRGFTLVELSVTIVIVVVLAVMSFSMVNRIKTDAKLTSSVSRVRDIGPMLHSYTQENNGRLPVWKSTDTYWWEMIADPEVYDPERLFKSPGHREFDVDRIESSISYGWNATVMGKAIEPIDGEAVGERRMVNFRRPSEALVLADGAKEDGFGLIEPGGPLPDPERYAGKVAALFLDGSARVMDAEKDFAEGSEWFETGDL